MKRKLGVFAMKRKVQVNRKRVGSILFRIFLVAVGIYTLPLFVVPLSLTVGINIGNATGIGVAVLFILYGVFFRKINSCIKAMLHRKFLRFVVYGMGTLLVTVGVLVIVLTSLMVHAMGKAPTGEETLVVLGCRVYGERASLSLRERLDAAYEYLEEHPQVCCVVSGGQGDGENISEAECMYRYLTQKGIDSDRIFLENKSRSTRENLEFSLEVIERENLPDEIAIVTSEYHQYRAGLVAKELGVQNTAVCGKTAPWLFPTFYIRELYGILYQWVF